MSDRGQHSEWLSLIDVSGPFLAEPVLKETFPQGLDGLDASKKKTLRQAYDEWREALDLDDPKLPDIHRAWVDLVLRQGLELDEDGASDVLKAANDLPEALKCEIPEHGVTLRPDYAVVDSGQDALPLMLVSVYEPDVPLGEALKRDGWAAAPAERMVELCRGTGVRLGLVTNGEHWMLVDAPVGAVTTLASWYARLWGQEPVTLQAFVNLLGIRRFFVDRGEQLPALLDNSLKHQDEVTDALGEQVRRAVEVLIQALDRADVDRNRELLKGVEPTELYEAGLTVMMRIVFLLSAEERGLLLMGDERYEGNYAVSTLRMQLRAESEEILERRWNAWSRLLSIFRAVYGGIDHEAMRLPALGGSLFDPDRFPFLEGRAKGTHWKSDPASPLPIDNRTVLLLLDAVQLFQGRTLSYRALDVEQIGYVYEGLLERTASRAAEVTLDLNATKNAKHPWVSLPELDDAAANGRPAVEELLKERAGSSASRIRNDLDKEVDEAAAEKLLTACHGDRALRDRVRPYFHLLRVDPWGYPLVYPQGTFTVTTGTDRRETGTHYTPKSLTEAIVKETLEPLVYVGPAEGKPRDDWHLRPPAELLDLKICDPAMGSGAFLVQVCRWLSERLVEAWGQAERQGEAITADGEVAGTIGSREPLRPDAEERVLTARRLIAERCLYGVDMNPLAVELAKLSIWLVTLAKGKPFGFLDHNLRCGDSLLGIANTLQLHSLELIPSTHAVKKLFAQDIDKAVNEAVLLRLALSARPINDIRDVEAMTDLDASARSKLELPSLAADALVAEFFANSGIDVDTTVLSVEVGGALEGGRSAVERLGKRALTNLAVDLPSQRAPRRPFHWLLQFPEVFLRPNGGFDAIVGNPPFLGGQRITGALGTSYRDFLVKYVAKGTRGSADLVAYFFLRAFELLRNNGTLGLLAVNTISEGDTRQVGLERLLKNHQATIYAAFPNEPWPGKAAVVTSRIHIRKGGWGGPSILASREVPFISAFLSDQDEWSPQRLTRNEGKSFIASYILGLGFTLSENEAARMLKDDPKNADVLFPYINGKDLNSHPEQKASRWVINFWDWPEEKARDYTEPYAVVLEKVKPERQRRKRNGDFQLRKPLPQRWWQYAEKRPTLYHAIGRGHAFIQHPPQWAPNMRPLEKIIGITRVSKFLNVALLPNDQVFTLDIIIFALNSFHEFALLQSNLHEVWTRKQASTQETRLRYTPSDCYETFPRPNTSWEQLTSLGSAYECLRSKIMKDLGIGLTKLYNRFHKPGEKSSALLELRDLHRQIDEAAAIAYGWNDLELEHGFHQVGYLPANDRMRFTISEAARLEILRRLSALNKSQFEAEQKLGLRAKVTVALEELLGDEVGEGDLFVAGGRQG